MPFTPTQGSNLTLVTLSGQSLYTTTGVYLISGSERGQCTILGTGNSFASFYPPSTPPGNLRSGNFSVYNAYGNATTSEYFTWLYPINISGFIPTSGFTGSSVTITGSGLRDVNTIYFGDISGNFSTAFTNNTWQVTVTVPFVSGGLPQRVNLRAINNGGTGISLITFTIKDDSLSLTGIAGFPGTINTYQYLRGDYTATVLEWRTPNQVLNDITGLLKSGGDVMTGNYCISGGELCLTGLEFHTSGLATGDILFRSRLFSGNTIIIEALIGGVTWRGFSYKFS